MPLQVRRLVTVKAGRDLTIPVDQRMAPSKGAFKTLDFPADERRIGLNHNSSWVTGR